MNQTERDAQSNLQDQIAQLALAHYDSLPEQTKPITRPNGTLEWTILAAFVLVASVLKPVVPGALEDHSDSGTSQQGACDSLTLVSLATGVKCLPTNRLPPCGDTLHDSHAEVLAKRGFQRFLLDQAALLLHGEHSEILVRDEGRFRLRSNTQVWMYTSTLPCGDASTLFTAAHQPLAMAQLKERLSNEMIVHEPELALPSISRGRNGYSYTSTLRTKPGRPDSFPSVSMSCSDKMASWNVLGLQGCLLAHLMDPVYLTGIVIGGFGGAPVSEDVVGFRKDGWVEANVSEIQRATYGRLEGIESDLNSPYRLSRPHIYSTGISFRYDRFALRQISPSQGSVEPVPQPTSILYMPHRTVSLEVLYQGCDRRKLWQAPGLQPLPENRRSAVCKLEMMRTLFELLSMSPGSDPDSPLFFDAITSGGHWTYHQLKHAATTTKYESVKQILRGQVGEPRLIKGFERCGPLCTTEAGYEGSRANAPPFVGWIVSGKRWESFDLAGTFS